MFCRSKRRGVGTLVLILMASATAEAQQTARSFEQLQVLVKPGDTIAVVDASGRESRGEILDISPSMLRLLVSGASRDLQQDEVRMIRQRRADPLKNGALWGFGIGAGFGYFLAAQGAGADGGYAGDAAALAPVLITASLGSGLGVAVDAMLSRQQVIFERPATSTPKIGFLPVLTRERKGVLVTWRF